MSTMSQRNHLTDSEACRVVGSVNGSETPKYERYSSPTTSSLGYWYHGFNSECPKPAPWCRSVCSPICVRLTSRHRCDRREWATEHVNWRKNEWSNVLFSDETRFSVHPNNRRIFIWRDRDSRNNPAIVHESVRFGGVGVLMYRGISIDGRTELYIIRDGPLTARRYRDEILRHIVVPYAAAIRDDFILMDDNCRSHRANLEDELLAANHPQKLSKNWKELFWKSGIEYPNS
ncbi:transposable element Tcb2 transposase [Trichonephila clavipes]|uniref:Transposable element Tcb2 transposase n=1 Tax=Trichonephila clavipes TaxID=2585209 RepID=A0A8X6S7G6_TRICX|nr:transposable element Tcb2 transposase [Trichonephila clavipes]